MVLLSSFVTCWCFHFHPVILNNNESVLFFLYTCCYTKFKLNFVSIETRTSVDTNAYKLQDMVVVDVALNVGVKANFAFLFTRMPVDRT